MRSQTSDSRFADKSLHTVSTLSQALKLQEIGLCFEGPLPEQAPDERNMPKGDMAESKGEMLKQGEKVPALVLAPDKHPSCKLHSTVTLASARLQDMSTSTFYYMRDLVCARNMIHQLLLNPAEASAFEEI